MVLSEWSEASISETDWLAPMARKVAAIEAAPDGLAVPSGDCSAPGGLSETRHRIEPHTDDVAGRHHVHRVEVLAVGCPGWAEPLTVVLGQSAPHAVCYSTEAGLPSDTALTWAPAWAAWAAAHKTAAEWCWYHGEMWFEVGGWALEWDHADLGHHLEPPGSSPVHSG